MAVVVTGASTGIGAALARAWGARGATVVLAARSAEALARVAEDVERAGGRAVVVTGDLARPEDRERLVATAAPLGIDVLVNNAGRGYHAPALAIDLDELRALLELNVVAPLHLVQLAAPALEAARGAVVMMSSITGVIAAPHFGAYAASKFALEAIAMSLRAELAASGVDVVVVRPGPVATPFRANAARAPGTVGYDAPAPGAQSAEDVAARTLRAVDRRRAVVATSLPVAAAILASRLAPAAVRAALRRRA